MGFCQWQPGPAACSQGRAWQCTKELPPQQQAGEERASEQRGRSGPGGVGVGHGTLAKQVVLRVPAGPRGREFLDFVHSSARSGPCLSPICHLAPCLLGQQPSVTLFLQPPGAPACRHPILPPLCQAQAWLVLSPTSDERMAVPGLSAGRCRLQSSHPLSCSREAV